MSRRVASVAAVAACAIYAALALASGLDRAAETHPDLGQMVPAFLQSQTLRSAGAAALASGDSAAALTLGERAVDDAPIDPQSTALLGAARLARGDAPTADRAFRVAARLGWRVPYTQLYVMGRALEEGDLRMAALRLDALVRQNPALLADRRLFDPFERSAVGRVALAERMSLKAPWLRRYAMDLASLPPDRLAQRVAVLFAVAQRGTQIGCQPVGAAVSRLIAAGQPAEAEQLWRAHCPGAGKGLLYDSDFAAARLDQTESEFAWFFIGNSQTSAVLSPASDGPGQTLTIDSTASLPEMIVRQLVFIPQGSYRLSWQAVSGDGSPSDRTLAFFSCANATRDFIEPALDPRSRRWFVTVTMDGACPARWIGFAARPGASGVRMGAVRLEALP
ncbi:hypothetical protein B0I00_1529 [Novosphingobium kunmingense]|uniref:Tetratricopeptide repeat protein n=1 Tax=Novosphingobium kunmingense TaxID=1211806 RepID=A0A2N0HKA2_9SPHN|nr:hypothetical protein [Novosphingobium kunmingense]PKB19298.1 hypothetical protein B0I00_1529 [Novosphingobium kunmingense]